METSGEAMVVGLGNLLCSDDGLGVHAIEYLGRDGRLPPEAKLLDGGTQGLDLIPFLSGYRRLLVIDAVDAGETPGALMRFEQEALGGLPGRPTVHQLGFADLMIAMKLLGEAPEEVVLLGVQPLSTDWGTELTPPVKNALPSVADAV
ncbi:MAG TPA: HyaD/HybD family hydrogenase maturation endopeptidase, partial [Bryobacteraceae bacterium]|nr:HyaD/HybD family hydrogenase maturation endopeptidase [Bryobacteraceae bacterium]